MKRFNMSNNFSFWVLIILILTGCAGETQPKQTLSDFTKAIDLDPTDAVAYYNRGNAFAEKGQYENAISDYNRAIEINPSFADAYINRGLAWGIRGYHDRAIADHDKAREITKREIPSKVSLTQGYINIAVKRARSAVVNISIVKVIEGEGGTGFWEQFFRDQIPRNFEVKRLGSGFIIDKDGFILTDNLEAEKTDELKVTLFDGREFDAMVIGRDPKTGLALIKIRSELNLPVARFGDSNKLKVGQWVLAIGNPFGLGITASVGIIDKNYSESSLSHLIRTTSNINLGNSGGTLINLNGEVIGINTFDSSQDFLNGNAIPINMAKALVVELKKNSSVSDKKLAQIKRRVILSTRQFGKESYENSSVVDKTQLENWINQEFIPSRIRSVVLIASYSGKPLGSGFIIDRDGFILTNDYIVEKAGRIKVKLADLREFDAKIVGRDRKTDLALIRIESNLQFEPLPLGDSDKLEIGNWVVPIGHPFGLNIPVTAGIVSAKYRKLGGGARNNLIQTDAPIRSGNGGGPLLKTTGEVVGINSYVFTRRGVSVNIGFAIPIDMAKDVLPQLKKGKVVRGWLGVLCQKITPELKDKLDLKDEKGALVADVVSGGPAEKAGLKRGDVIVSFDGKEIDEMSELPYIVASTPIGKSVVVEVIRQGKKNTFQLKVGELKDESKPPAVSEAKPDLGLTLKEITPELARNFRLSETTGLVVVQVEANSSAAEAGLAPGDIILEVDQEPLKSLGEFNKNITSYGAGDTVLLLINRRGTRLYLTLKIWE